jgi:acetylornithine deacetylase/succinyl-diaminopimelate desuccinylase-like protein
MTGIPDPAVARALDEARQICAVAAPPFQEAARGDLVARLFAEAGVAVDRDAAGNVLAALGEGAAEDTVVFAAHLDTVFTAGTEIAFDERDGRLAAPGIGDNSLAVAALNAHRLDEYIDLAPVPAGLAALEALAVELAAPATD